MLFPRGFFLCEFTLCPVALECPHEMVPDSVVLVGRLEGWGEVAAERGHCDLSSDKEDFVILCNSVVTEKILTISISSHASGGLVQLLVQQHAEPCRLSWL